MFDDFLIHPTKMVIRHAKPDAKGELIEGVPARVDMDRLDEMMRRCNAQFGSAREIGGPELPVVEVAKPKRRRAA